MEKTRNLFVPSIVMLVVGLLCVCVQACVPQWQAEAWDGEKMKAELSTGKVHIGYSGTTYWSNTWDQVKCTRGETKKKMVNLVSSEDSDKSDSGVEFFIHNDKGTQEVHNALNVYKAKAAQIDGRWADLKVTLSYVKIKGDSDDFNKTHRIMFARLTENNLYIGTKSKHYGDTVKGNSGARYQVNVQASWTWTDDGSRCGFPFIYTAADVDQYTEGESITFRDYSSWGDFYAYSGSELDQVEGSYSKGNGWRVEHKRKYAESVDEGSTKVKAHVLSKSGWNYMSFEGGCCNTLFQVSPPRVSSTPNKYLQSSSSAKIGEEVTWVLDRNMPTFYKDLLAPFPSCAIYDKLDSALKYRSATVWLGSKEVTNQGTLSVNGQNVTWNASSNFLKEKSNYNGQSLRMVLKTTAQDVGEISNSYKTTFINDYWSKAKTIDVPATINYYRDYQAGDTTPCYVDKTVNTSSGYQVSSKADAAAKRADCSGLDGWYTDPECTEKYDGSWVPSSTDYVLNLYSKNKVTLSYAATSDSWFNKHPSRSVFADKDLSDKLADRTAGKTASGASIFPASKEAYYGDVIAVDSGESLWFESEIFGSGDKATRELKCSDGVYAYQDGSGDLLKEVRLTSNSTAYLKWLAGSYDGVYAAG